MVAEFRVTTDAEEFKKIRDENTDKDVERDRKARIIQRYCGEYSIKGELADFQGKQVHIDYLPTLDMMMKSKKRYKEPKEVIGASLFKIEKDYTIFLTDDRDPNLQSVYRAHRRSADRLAKRLYNLNAIEFECQWTDQMAKILSTSFAITFGQSLGGWKSSLRQTE